MEKKKIEERLRQAETAIALVLAIITKAEIITAEEFDEVKKELDKLR